MTSLSDRRFAILARAILALMAAAPISALAKGGGGGGGGGGGHGSGSASGSQHSSANASAPSSPISRTTTSAIDTTKDGIGTITTTVTGTANDKTVTRSVSFQDGVSYTSVSSVMKAGDVTQIDTTTGKTMRDTTVIGTSVPGDFTLSGQVINTSNNKVVTFTGTRDATIYGSDTSLSYSNGAKINDQTLRAPGAVANIYTGVNAKGQAVNSATLVANPSAALANHVTTTGDGPGIWSSTTTQGNGITTVQGSRSFADGAKSTSTLTSAPGANGSTVIGRTSGATTAAGATYQSSSSLTYAPNASGTSSSVSGTFSQTGGNKGLGYAGTVAGTDTKQPYGYSTALSYAAAGGAAKTTSVQSLVVNGAQLNVNKVQTFTGVASSSAGLITGQVNAAVGHPGLY